LKKSALNVPLLLALTCAVVMAACGDAVTTRGTPGTSPAPTQGQALTPAPTPTPTPKPTPAPALVTVAGLVTQLSAAGDFILTDADTSYSVAMSRTTKVINLPGREVPRQFIKVAGSVQVTGTLSGSTISAQTVLIPTKKDRP
jgi:hypothetical protein